LRHLQIPASMLQLLPPYPEVRSKGACRKTPTLLPHSICDIYHTVTAAPCVGACSRGVIRNAGVARCDCLPAACCRQWCVSPWLNRRYAFSPISANLLNS
jgi:hypothetical protein